ncbi:MAG: PKD domain-containing protein [Bacteroidetes bacterium]|nr:PKD domain-containing protein [Bacteroidota bacterium]
MKKIKTQSQRIKVVILTMIFVFFAAFTACKDDIETEEPIASFQYEIDATNFLTVIFTNYSQNATSYEWDFGDNNVSTEMSPVHIYETTGTYTVVLTAINDEGAYATYSKDITINDPQTALTLLAGVESKTWKLYRVGTSLGVGPDADNPRGWWALENNGTRPCLYYHEFTFHRNGTYVFDDKGSMWGEEGVFHESVEATCFGAIASNMVGPNGENLSAWLGGTHAFEYTPSSGTLKLIGTGAWIGLVKTGTAGEVTVPQNSVTTKITIEQRDGYDYMHVLFQYEWGVWSFSYAHYFDSTLEPDVVEEEEPWGEDLPNITPNELFHTFETASTFELIGAIGGTSVITVGQTDPLGGGTNVGKFERVAGEQWQEAQLRTTPTLYDIQFNNFNVAKIDIYIPAGTDFTTLQRTFVFGFADQSATQEWWNSPVQFVKSGDDVILGAWHTYTFDLTDVKARNDIDMIYLGIGGGGHAAGGVFYVRNLIFE